MDTKIKSHETQLVFITQFNNLSNQVLYKKKKNQIKNENDSLERELKKLNSEINRYNKEIKETQEDITKMAKTYPWLSVEYENFGSIH